MEIYQFKKELNILILEMDSILERLNKEYFLITEKYGEDDSEMILEGFWDTLKKGASKVSQAAHTIGKTVGKTVKDIKGASSWAWEKGVELGKKALNVIDRISEKVHGYITKAYNFIITSPGIFMRKMEEMWSELKNNLYLLKKSAGEKYDQVVRTISEKISSKIIEPLKSKWSEIKNSYYKNKEELEEKADDLKMMANSFIKSGKENLVVIGNGILKGLKNSGYFAIGLVILPFYLVFKGSEFLYSIGDKVIQNIKENVPEVWNSLQIKEEFKKGYKEGTNESKILNFDDFLNLKS